MLSLCCQVPRDCYFFHRGDSQQNDPHNPTILSHPLLLKLKPLGFTIHRPFVKALLAQKLSPGFHAVLKRLTHVTTRNFEVDRQIPPLPAYLQREFLAGTGFVLTDRNRAIITVAANDPLACFGLVEAFSPP